MILLQILDVVLKILLIGETCRDVYHFGRTARLSPEGPVPIFIPSKTIDKSGMASNVYENICALGHDVTFLSNEAIHMVLFGRKKLKALFLESQ